MEDAAEQSRVCDIPGVAHMVHPALLVTPPLRLVHIPTTGRDDWRTVRHPRVIKRGKIDFARMQARAYWVATTRVNRGPQPWYPGRRWQGMSANWSKQARARSNEDVPVRCERWAISLTSGIGSEGVQA
jgi:hypothetical protein